MRMASMIMSGSVGTGSVPVTFDDGAGAGLVADCPFAGDTRATVATAVSNTNIREVRRANFFNIGISFGALVALRGD
jgi:hypothetical protein